MRIGVVSYWFNRGQATVGRHLRGILDELGHETAVLARPTKANFQRPSYIERHDVWDQPRVTSASHFLIPADEYLQWAQELELDAVMLDQNYQFDEIEQLRASGIRTIGRFVWEAFREEDVPGALRAYDVIYSLTRCERDRYRALGIDSPFVPWGCHPELLSVPVERDTSVVTYFFPGGYLSRRKPLREVVTAFASVPDPRLRLLVKVQGARGESEAELELARRTPRVTVVEGDLPTHQHRELMASADVCVAPSRWEGLGLHLYEATALGLPIITNDRPPMDEVVHHEDNGLLIESLPAEPAFSGVPAFDPDPAALTAAIRRLADDTTRERLSANARRASRDRLSWRRTVASIGELVGAAP
ncbi:MAG TPA: glycosyltransferase family 4 protein [Solirubrobacterales bacterium]|nr:glycosyltransferase family 4 protein [Solirubrobacterales bacterium]